MVLLSSRLRMRTLDRSDGGVTWNLQLPQGYCGSCEAFVVLAIGS